MADFIFYFKLGWFHILSLDALDHLYFITVLTIVYTFSSWKRVLVLITAFTIGHAITLFLSALDILRFNDQYVEFAIPCTIFISAAVNLWRRDGFWEASRIQYLLAILFGLVHGMGFANAIRFMLSSDQHIISSLLSFNIGLESGQIFVVLLVLFVGWFVQRMKLFSQRDWVLIFSSIIFGLSFQMAIERFPFL
ncbi:MAG: HupE / UreJ protein [Chitinophagaceae bacterium]|nr:MAG: HupE / UreJ protein [Chitinophagaceae bacterium]